MPFGRFVFSGNASIRYLDDLLIPTRHVEYIGYPRL